MVNTLASPLKWHGGKGAFQGKLAQWIIGLMPSRETWHLFSEPYFGSGAVSFTLDPEGISELHNDINKELMGFWRALRVEQNFGVFRRKVEAIPFAEQAWVDSSVPQRIPVDRAVNFFVRCRQSLAGRMKNYTTSTTRIRRGMNENVSAWLTVIEGLPEVHTRVKRMEFQCQDAVDFIVRFDHPYRLFYCDPPYLQETRTAKNTYKYEMTASQHEELLETLAHIKGQFLLSGYKSKMYHSFARRHKWGRREFRISNNAAGGAEKRQMTECVWFR